MTGGIALQLRNNKHHLQQMTLVPSKKGLHISLASQPLGDRDLCFFLLVCVSVFVSHTAA